MLRKLALSLAVAGVIGASNASALGLGEIHIKSALNEPLEAEIQLLQMRDVDPGLVQPRMANIDEFALAGIDKLRFLSNVKFEVRNRADGRGVIHMTSATPVKEPFLNFLVEVNWPSGRLVREYTVLLDPPVYDPTPTRNTIQPAQSQSVKGAATVSSQPLPASSALPANNIRTRTNPESQVYIDVNDTLWNIAKKHRPAASVSEAQMMLALQRKNPEAFTNNNVNQLKAGVVLDIPTLEEVQLLTPKQANDEFWRQTAIWRRGGVANPKKQPVVVPPKNEGAEPKKGSEVVGESTAGQLKIVSPSQNKAPEIGVVADQLVDTKIDQEKAALIAENQQLEAQLATALETVDQIQRENEEFSGRVDALAQQMESLQRLLELKDQQLATLQAELDAAKQQPVIAAPAEPVAKKSLLDEFGLYIVGGGAALLALVVGLVLLVMGRRRKQKQEDETSQEATTAGAAVIAGAVAEGVEEAVAGDAEAEAVSEESEVGATAQDAVAEEVAELEDEDFSDLDLDLEMDLEDVAAEQIDDEEFDLGLDDLEQSVDSGDQSPAEESLVEEQPVEVEEIDDALDAILGEDAESIDLDDDLAFDIQPVIETESVESVPDESELEGLDFNLDDLDTAVDSSAVESSVADELDVELLDDSEDLLSELEMDITSDEEELADLDALLGLETSKDNGELQSEDVVSADAETEAVEDELSDLDMLLGEVGEAEIDEFEVAETEVEESNDQDLDSLLAGLDEPVDADSTDEDLTDLDALLTEVEIDLEEPINADSSGEDLTDLDALLTEVGVELEEPVNADSADEDLTDLDALLTEVGVELEEPVNADPTDEDLTDLDALLTEVEVELDEPVDADSSDDDLADLDALLTEVGVELEEPVNADPTDEDLTDLDALLTEVGVELDEPVNADPTGEDLTDLDALLTEVEVELDEPVDADSSGDDLADLDALLAEVEVEEPVDLGSIDDEITDLDELLGDSETLIEKTVEETVEGVDTPVGMHPDLEDLLSSVNDDVVLHEQDADSSVEGALEASIGHDLEAELDLELESLLNGAGDSEVTLTESDDDEDSFGGLNLLDGADEVETKLDLARAYIDMEDMDGAKDILQEVVTEGSDSQQKEANKLIELID